MKLLIVVTAVAAVFASATPSNGLTFDFSFTNSGTPGTTAGTVTGEIFGLTNNTTSAATAIIINGYPSALGDIHKPINLFSYPLIAGNPNSIATNSFTVSGGQITAVDFYADGQCLPSAPCGYAPLFLYLVSATSSSSYVFGASDPLTGISNGAVVSDSITFASASPSVAATPLPAALPLYATGLGALALLRWHRKRKAGVA
jgi:hypothetical protein